MQKSNSLRYVVPLISVVLLLIIGSNFYVYDKLSDDYTNKITSLNQKIDSLESELKQEVEKEKLTREEELNKLDTKTSDIKKNLESQVKDVSGNLEEVKSNTAENLADLSNKLSEIQVSSSDFSSIIEDVVKAVVNVRTNLGQGSGVIFDSNGYLVTNNHVINGATEINVVDYNGNSYTAVVIRTDTTSDLAALKIEGNGFPYLDFEDISNVNIGDRVIAVGNPLGLSFSVTEGIISGLNRQVDNSGIGYIQTDVPINPGNSGGPLVNSAKKIVGITTLKISNSEGLGFAIPTNVVKNFAKSALG
ncbi:MAG TPA: trypsin-like peptidase domain-containing protein [Candidatus Nanoarchaeia archaeon]|nr:trypsin-like peptidase domain-containing protein [Candidatus Nanoarchaeia archaeon]